MIDSDLPDASEVVIDDEMSQPIRSSEPEPIPGPSGIVPMSSVVVVPSDTMKHSEATDSVPPATEELDSELLAILGTDPSIEKSYGKDIQKDLASRLQHWTTEGLTKEGRKDLKEKYLTPGNCKLIDAPELNAEIKAAVSDELAKRDKALSIKQQQITTAITCLGEAITLLLSEKEKNTNLIKLTTDAARLMSDCHYSFSTTRRNFLLGALKKEVRDQLRVTKIDKFLFGDNLAETLKSAKAINKSGSELKVTAPKSQPKRPIQNTASSSKHLNWRSQGPARRQTGPPKTKEPAMTSMRGRPANSSKQSQHLQQRPSFNRR